jgi:hypothetical protein
MGENRRVSVGETDHPAAFFTVAGLPTATEHDGIGLTTTLPAPITLSLPTSAITTELLPIQALRPIRSFANLPPWAFRGTVGSSEWC